jgi:hypothetical protein
MARYAKNHPWPCEICGTVTRASYPKRTCGGYACGRELARREREAAARAYAMGFDPYQGPDAPLRVDGELVGVPHEYGRCGGVWRCV